MLLPFFKFFVYASVDCACCLCRRNDFGVRGTHFIIQSTAKVGLLTLSLIIPSNFFYALEDERAHP
jgi:hypothetical protein